jgi:glycerate kinase
MRAKVLIIPDKFKGTLSAEKAALAIAAGWARQRRDDQLTLLPMSDGGDGFGKIIGGLLSARMQRVETVDAAHRPIVANWWWAQKAKTAIIESAAVIGLAQLPHGHHHPFELDTFGLGKVLQAAARKGARRCIIGIGGSATNDGGFGMARARGWRFFDHQRNEITRWMDLDRLTLIRAGKLRFAEILVAVDVQNPLLGFKGATRVYGPQKGLRPRDFDEAERALRRLAAVTKHFAGLDYSRLPGAGAAGGLGFGLLAFAEARLTSGFELFVELSRLNSRLRDADLVITGEGAIDRSTLMGKGVGEIAERCRRLKIPCLGLGGTVSPDAAKSRLFIEARALTELTTKESALAKPAYWLTRLANRAARDWNPGT